MLEKELLDKMIYRSLEEIQTPKQGRTCHVDKWWVFHSEKGFAFYETTQSPQCNDHQPCVEDWAKRFPGHEAKFLSVAYI